MKFTKLYISREDLKEKLGIESHQFVIADVTNTLDEIEFTLAIDDNAVTKGEVMTGKVISSSDNLRRFRLNESDEHLKNTYALEVDLKKLYTGETPVLFKGDTNEIIFNVTENGNKFNIDSATEALITFIDSAEKRREFPCSFEQLNNKRIIKCSINTSDVSIGYMKVWLTIKDNQGEITLQSLNFLIQDKK